MNTTDEGFSLSFHKHYKLRPTYPQHAIFSLRELQQTSPSALRAETSFRYQSDPPENPTCHTDEGGCQLGLLSINFVFRNVIFQPIVFPFVWAKYKWNFMRDRCKRSFPLPLAASPLARSRETRFARPNRRACLQASASIKHYKIVWMLRTLWLVVVHELLEYRYMDDVTGNLFSLFCSTWRTVLHIVVRLFRIEQVKASKTVQKEPFT